MNDAILVAVITASASVICQIIISASSNRRKREEDHERDILLEARLKSVEKKLDEHNNYARRFEEIEKQIVRIATKLESMKGA